MFSRVALLSQPDADLEKVRALLSSGKFAVREFLSMEEIQRSLSTSQFDVLVMRLQTPNLETVARLAKIHARFPGIPLITVAPAIDPGVRYLARSFEFHRFIEDPLEIADLPRLVETLRTRNKIAARLHPRVRRFGRLELVNSETGERLAADFVDFAQMGARLVVHGKKKIDVRSRWQMHYPSSSEPGKIKRLESTVVWEAGVKTSALESLVAQARVTVGVRFIAVL